MNGNKNNQTIKPALVTRIEVERLFGRYNYKIEMPILETDTISKIAMLYGDNGTGKTTILKLVYHLISPRGNRGHRSFVGRIPFARFAVVFSDGTRIEAVREGLNLTGCYTIAITKSKRPRMKGEIVPDAEGKVTSSGTSAQAEKVLAEIGKLELSVFLLGDDRVLLSDQFEEDSEGFQTFETRHYSDEDAREIRRRRVVRIAGDRREYELRKSLERTETWLLRRSIQASSRGEAEAQQIYANIVETINRIGLPEAGAYKAEKEKLIEQLKELDERSSSHERFGLIPRINAGRFVKSLADATSEGLPFVSQVVRSFVDSQKARLDSLDELYDLLNRFIILINGFLQDKYIVMGAREGISIMIDSRTLLDPENLSSGEKQLLLMFCNVLASSEMASFFLIDEPEISLNVKWQRKLVDSLIDITGKTNCQFLLATHSIALLTKHGSQTIRLTTA